MNLARQHYVKLQTEIVKDDFMLWQVKVLYHILASSFLRSLNNLNLTVQLQRFMGKKCSENIATASIFSSLPSIISCYIPSSCSCLPQNSQQGGETFRFSAKNSENPYVWKVQEWVNVCTVLRGIKCAGREKLKLITTALTWQSEKFLIKKRRDI